MLVDNIILFLDAKARIRQLSKTGYELLGYKEGQLTGKNWFDTIVDPEKSNKLQQMFDDFLNNKNNAFADYQNSVLTNNGERKKIVWHNTIVNDEKGSVLGTLGHGRLVKINDKVILKEVHHRVKNNFQFILSLLSLQSKSIKDRQALSIVKEMQQRIRSMALVHETLYYSDNMQVNIKQYIRTIVNDLVRSYKPYRRKIRFTMQIEDLNFDQNSAISCGLIISELISNSLKYAFNNRSGEIKINLMSKINNIELIISDNGSWIANSKRTSTSFGLQLVEILTEQLEGKLEITRKHGTSFKILFPRSI